MGARPAFEIARCHVLNCSQVRAPHEGRLSKACETGGRPRQVLLLLRSVIC